MQKNESTPLIRILADSREINSGVLLQLSRMADVHLDIQQLDVADYVLGDDFGIERKSVNDFVASIFDGRIFGQLAMLSSTYQTAVVLLEGHIGEIQSDISMESLQGALSYVAALSGCSIIPSPNTTFTAGLLKTMARHVQHGLGYEVPLRSGKPKDARPAMQYLIEGLPSVGPGRAQKLLTHFGSPARVFAADAEDLAGVPGIGAGTAAKIIAILDGRWKKP